MTGTERLRAAVTGLIGLAATAEQELMAWPERAASGSAQHWAALPVIAHNTEFRRQQVQRLRAIRTGDAPPEFAEVDHASATCTPSWRHSRLMPSPVIAGASQASLPRRCAWSAART